MISQAGALHKCCVCRGGLRGQVRPLTSVSALQARRADDDHAQGHHYSSGRRAGGRVLRRHGIFPDHHQGAARREPLLAAAGLPRCRRQADALHPKFRHQDAASQHPGRCLRRQSQAAADAAVLAHDEQRSVREGLGGGRPHGERHRLRDVHALAHRSRRLEHKARKRPLGADISQGEIHHGRPRARALDGAAEGQSRQRAVDHQLGAADHRRQARADRQKRFRLR